MQILKDYMESGTPGRKSTRDGWLNRYLHAKEHEEASAFRAVSLSEIKGSLRREKDAAGVALPGAGEG